MGRGSPPEARELPLVLGRGRHELLDLLAGDSGEARDDLAVDAERVVRPPDCPERDRLVQEGHGDGIEDANLGRVAEPGNDLVVVAEPLDELSPLLERVPLVREGQRDDAADALSRLSAESRDDLIVGTLRLVQTPERAER